MSPSPGTSTTGRPHVFKGALAFNQRTVVSVFTTLLEEVSATESLRGKPLTLAELVDVLLLLESFAMSSDVHIDGTLPPDDLSSFKDLEWRVEIRSGVPIGVKFLSTKADRLLDLFKESIESASLLIEDNLARLPEQPDKPMQGDVSPFVDALLRAAADSSGRTAREIAARVAAAAAEGKETFRGSKCVAGLLLADDSIAAVRDRAADILRLADDATRRKTVSLLINRFRINYVNALAGLANAAFLADVSIEGHKSAQVMLFCRYLAKQIASEHVDELSSTTRALFDTTLSGVPLGFAILMNSRARRPLDLIEEAAHLRDRSFCRAAAAESPQERFVHEMTHDAFSDFQEYLFGSRFHDLAKQADRLDGTRSGWRTLAIPSAAAGVIGAVLGTLTTTVSGAAGAALLAHGVQLLGEQVQAGRLGKRKVHVDHYRRLDAYVSRAVEQDQRVGRAFSDQVEMIFGRPLALPSA